MGLVAALTHRVSDCCGAVVDHGYDILESSVSVGLDELLLVAQRRVLHGGPPTTLRITEIWADGLDPLRLAPPLDGCHLHLCSWHAQVGGPGDLRAERLDIDRRKPTSHTRHRHPYGRPNAHREPTTICTLPAWLAEVEGIVASLHLAADRATSPRVD